MADSVNHPAHYIDCCNMDDLDAFARCAADGLQEEVRHHMTLPEIIANLERQAQEQQEMAFDCDASGYPFYADIMDDITALRSAAELLREAYPLAGPLTPEEGGM